MEQLKRLIREIHRRSLWQVLAVYVGASWVVFEIVQTVTEGLGLPQWFPPFAALLLLIGLPIVLATAFVQEGISPARAHDPTLVPDVDRGAEAKREEPKATRRLFTWRNALLGGLIAFALWGALAAGWLVLRGGLPPSGESGAELSVSANRVAVLPFSVRGGSEFEYLGEGIVNLLVTKLDGAGALTPVDPRSVLAAVERAAPAGGHGVAPEPGRSIARRFDAGLYILGDILEVSGRLRIDASLYDTTGDRETLARATAEGEADDVFEIVDSLAVQLLTEWGGGAGERLTRVAAATTGSLPALKAYLAGAKELRAGRFEAAVREFERAVEADTSFALAYYRLGVAAQWLDRLVLAREAIEEAARRSDRLSARDRQRVVAFRARIGGAVDEAERIYREILGAHPNDVEAWWQLGEILFHQNPHRGRPIVESRTAWQRILTLEPDHGPALVHLARVAALEGKAQELDSLMERGRQLGMEGEYARSVRLLRAFVRSDAETRAQIAEELHGVDDHAAARAVWMVANFTLDLQGALELIRQETEATRSPGLQARGHLDRAHLQLAFGRRTAALEALVALGTLNRRVALEHRALFVTAPFLSALQGELPDPESEPSASAEDRRVSEAVLLAMRDSLVSWRPGAASSVPVHVSPDSSAHPEIGLYLSGLLSAHLGDRGATRRATAALDSVARREEQGALAQNLLQDLRAESAWRAGEIDATLAAFRRERIGVPTALATNSAFYAGARGRWIRAEALRNAGRAREALRWYGTFAGHSNFDLIYLAPAHLRRAEIHESLGSPEKAVRHYRRFVELWADCDPELRPILERAKARIAALSSASASAQEPAGLVGVTP